MIIIKWIIIIATIAAGIYTIWYYIFKDIDEIDEDNYPYA